MKTRKYFLLALLFLTVTLLPGCKTAVDNKKAVDASEFTVVHPDWSVDATLYEVNVRQFSEEGTFKGVENRLDSLENLGVKVLWLMPVNPIGVLNRKGELGSYYSVKDYKDVNPEFGTMQDFKELVDAIHQHGMYVILDWVPNHSSWDNALATEHPDWYDHDSTGNFVAPYDWTDVIKFNWSSEGLQDYMLGALEFWVRDYDVDGFRVDHPHETPEAFWARVNPALNSIRPVMMLAENEDQVYFLKKGFGMNYSWTLHHMMNEVAQGKAKASTLDAQLNKEFSIFPKSVYRLRFIDNHDENSWAGTIKERMGDSEKAFAAFMFTIPGVPLLYNGQEVGLDKRLKFFERDPINWHPSELTSFYKTLIAMKKNNPALYNGNAGGDFKKVALSGDEDVYSYTRTLDNNTVFTVINFSAEPAEITIDDASVAGDYNDVFKNSAVSISKGDTVHLDGWGYKVMVR